MLRSFHQLQESARGYSLTQLFGLPTIRRYRTLVRQHVPQDPRRRILEIGCGVGSARPLFTSDYTGIDINPDYIEKARRKLNGRFYVMDAARMPFEPNAFDDAISIATAHHLTDEQLSAMVSKAATVASCVHIIDAILPISPNSWLKNILFQMDRGRYVRTFDQLRGIVGRNARIEYQRRTIARRLLYSCFTSWLSRRFGDAVGDVPPTRAAALNPALKRKALTGAGNLRGLQL